MKALIICTLAVACAGAAGVGARQRFQSRAELVSVDVLVTDGRRPVGGLSARDFELFDNGVPQAVEQLYVEQLPVNVIMVLDTSGSVRGERLDSLKRGAVAVIDRLRPGDRAAIVNFSHRLAMGAALTADRAALRAAVSALEASGSTSLRDAAFAGLALRGSDSTRTLLLVFSDGVDTASILAESSVLEAARRSDAIVYAIGIRDPPPPIQVRGRLMTRASREPVSDDRFLKRLSAEAGGRLLYAEQNRDVERTFARVLEEFNSRYVLGYAPARVASGGWHRVDVRLRNRKGAVLARRGYFAD